MDATVAVLAGGSSTRMGRTKATVRIAGHALISYPIAAAQAAGLERFVVAKRGSELPEIYCPVVIEPDSPTHPLLGLVTALGHRQGPVLALACDMAFIDEKLLAWLASHPSTTVVEAGGVLQPLLARYRIEDLPALEEALRREEPMQAAVAALDPTVVPESDVARFGDPERLCFNVNTPEDVEETERIFASLRG
ncbi:MAG: molybdenum cofactor guanylyltransferase [Solirubrobacterales bacterium]